MRTDIDELKALETKFAALLAACNFALHYIEDDLCHYEDVANEEAYNYCIKARNKIKKLVKKATE